jgi:hypothetical protein
LAEKRILQEFLHLGSFFNVEIWPPPPPSWQRKGIYKNSYIRDRFSTLKYDPPLLADKRILQDILHLGSFFNVEIWHPPPMAKKVH